MPVVTPLKEVADIIKEAGGEELKLCYQCGVCPWIRTILLRLKTLPN